MRVKEYLKCLFVRKHRFKPSQQKPGKETCTFCGKRRPLSGKSF